MASNFTSSLNVYLRYCDKIFRVYSLLPTVHITYSVAHRASPIICMATHSFIMLEDKHDSTAHSGQSRTDTFSAKPRCLASLSLTAVSNEPGRAVDK